MPRNCVRASLQYVFMSALQLVKTPMSYLEGFWGGGEHNVLDCSVLVFYYVPVYVLSQSVYECVCAECVLSV